MKYKNKNKKAMFFTIVAIALISLFLLSYTFYSVVKDRKAVTKRIDTMNNFIVSMEEDLPRQLYVAGFRIIFLFEKRITETGQYIVDFNSTFEDAFFNGEIYGQPEEIMNGAKFSDIHSSIQEKADRVNLDVSFLNSNISVSQENPWNVKITLRAGLLVEDKANLALWNKTTVFSAEVPVEGFEDPLYLISTNGFVTNEINQTIYDDFVDGSDVSNLLSHVGSSYYIASESAPSFLDRLQGRLEASENGIESLVYLPELSSQGITVKQKSCVDYIYFSSNNPASYQIQGIPSWFRMDDENNHLDVYEVRGLII